MRALRLLALLAVLLAPLPTLAAPTLVQHGVSTEANCNSTVVASFSFTLGATVASGDALTGFVVLGNVDNTAALTSVTDDKSNTYTIDKAVQSTGDTVTFFTFHLANITNTPQTLTANLSPSQSFVRIGAAEWSGVATLSPLDGTPAGQWQTVVSSTTSGNTTTTQNGDLIYGAVTRTSAGTQAYVQGSGFTLIDEDGGTTPCPSAHEFQVQSASGAIAATFSSISSDYETEVFALKAAGGAAPTCPKTLALMGVGC